VERALWVLLAVAFLVAVPVLVPMAGNATRAENLRLVHQEQSWREVNAVAINAAPARMDGLDSSATVWVSGQWQAPAGVRRSGLIPVPPGTQAGSRVTIWVDGRGTVTNLRPVSMDAVTFRVIIVEILVAMGLAMVGLGAGCAVRWAANRRRMAYWAIEWACFGPRWSARH